MPLLPPPLIVLSASSMLAALLFAAAIGLRLMDKRVRLQRVRSAIGERSNRSTEGGGVKVPMGQLRWKRAIDFMRTANSRLSRAKDRQARELRIMLLASGFRGRDAPVVFSFFKMMAPLVFLVGTALVVYGFVGTGRGPFADAAVVLTSALLGSKLPDLITRARRKRRLESLRKSLPDALDMLVICAEAGLASDAALKRVVAEIGRTPTPLSEELMQTALELGFSPDRRQAFEHLAERAPLPSINAFVTTLVQAEKYGTPLARAFKVLSQEQRAERMLRAEEKAGRLPATMTVPMMLFIMPALFIVLLGPAALDIIDNFIGTGG